MYAYLNGKLSARKSDRIIVEVGGIGYNVWYPVGRIPYLPPVGAQITVYTYTSVREDALQLYGFPTEDDLDLFIQLIGVSGVGPKAAQSLLSELTAGEIRMAIIGADAKTLCKAQGVAKKTAERLIVDLKGKISAEQAAGLESYLTDGQGLSEIGQADGVDGLDVAAQEAVEALVALGYGAREARAAVQRSEADHLAAGEDSAAADTESLLKRALRYL